MYFQLKWYANKLFSRIDTIITNNAQCIHTPGWKHESDNLLQFAFRL